MKLADAMSSIKSGDIFAFANETSVVDRLISLWTRSPYDHVAIAYWKSGVLQLAQATYGAGCTLVPAQPSAISSHTGTCYWLANNLAWNAAADAALNGAIGQPYSFLAEIEVGLDLEPAANQYICSIYAADILTPAGLTISRRGCTPATVVAACLGRGSKMTQITQS
jgi:hypothetical protein